MADNVTQTSLVDTLALAIVAASTAPLLLLDEGLKIIAASTSFYATFDIEAGSAVGRALGELGGREWAVPQLQFLLTSTLAGTAVVDAYEFVFRPEGKPERTLMLNARRLEGHDAVRLLLTLSDVTETRIASRVAEDMLREKAVLMQEIQHRVANSLQIIASVLMQSARNVQSEETRRHLREAHSRVMSMATAQQKLAGQQVGEVDLKPYFTELCASLGASMIRDPSLQSIIVTADDSRVKADVSVSLGLIVTELVINALKHAFPSGGEGRITVDYKSRGPNWVLRVADNGVGMPKHGADIRPGLGSSIVDALARTLKAEIHTADAHPGTAVSISHNRIAAVEDTVEAV
jgi:two-component sensor histidine kinase